jgi:general secretion pathway protein L
MREPLTIDFATPAQIADVPGLVSRFFSWWTAELRAMLPFGAARPPARGTLLYAHKDRWFLLQAAADRPVALNPAASDGALADQILRVAHGAPLSGLTLLLPREHVILRRLELPQMSTANLRQAVELQVDRLSPFKSDAVRVAARSAGYDAEKGAMLVDVAIAPLIRVQPIEQRLRALGLGAAAVDVEGEDGTPQGFDLAEPPSADEVRRRRTLNIGLAVVAVAVWGFAFYAWNRAGEREIADWESQIAALRPAAEQSVALRNRLEGMTAPIGAARAHQPSAMLDVLQQLTRVLPDTCRVVDLRVEGNVVQLSGLSPSAPELVGLLEKSDAFSNVKFVSPVVRKAQSTLERFEIAMQREARAP